MDFFAHQNKARSLSSRLVFLFLTAIFSIVCAVYGAVILVFFYSSDPAQSGFHPSFQWFDPHLFLIISGVTLLIILSASMARIFALSKGGSAVAEALGGRLLNRSTSDPDERKILNVVEEVAIASGVPMPQVFLLDEEEGINAFAAGFSPNDAAIGVTRGCARMLKRDELQGVIAHEFSHILNGDMRLNIRLMGGLAGIMAIASIAYHLLRGSRRRSGRSKEIGGGGIFLFALLLLLIGYIGQLFGRLIQSAVSRQREYLADASAVQFTRNPQGIAGALKKIGGFSSGSKVLSPMASEANHLFFSAAMSTLFASHPPLAERIRRVEPDFTGGWNNDVERPREEETNQARPFSAFTGTETHKIPIDPQNFANRAGTLDPETLRRGAEILAAISPGIRYELGDILGASSVVCALLLGRSKEERDWQYKDLNRMAPQELVRQISLVEKEMGDLDMGLRLPLVDLAIPALRMMSAPQFETLKSCMDTLMEADRKISLFEFSVKAVVTHRLNAAFKDARQHVTYKNITPLASNIVDLLSLLARVGHPDIQKAGQAFASAMLIIPVHIATKELRKEVTHQDMDRALARFSLASPGIKRTLLDACAQCVLFDREVTMREAELLRAVAYAMDVPVPPFLIETSQ